MEVSKLSSNWKKLQAQLKDQGSSDKSGTGSGTGSGIQKRKRETGSKPDRIHEKPKHDPSKTKLLTTSKTKSSKMNESPASSKSPAATKKNKVNAGLSEGVEIGKYVALDCEMVGVGQVSPLGQTQSALARVSIVNYHGEQVYDSYVKPTREVTDWRTHVSGILPKHMAVARSFDEVQQTVLNIIQGRILVGHSISYDLDVLLLTHPRRDIRDTANHTPYRNLVGGSTPGLKLLASELLGINIQDGEHSSVEDAQVCMSLFKRDQAAFERENARRYPPLRAPPPPSADTDDKEKKKKKKKKKSK